MVRALMIAGLVVGCAAYEPPGLDRTRAAYQTDLDECQENEPVVVDAYNAKVAVRWFVSPFKRPFQVREAIRSCMTAKGYKIAG